MSLEKIVNALARPVEALARFVYDAAFCTSVETTKDEKGVEITRKNYSESSLQKYFDRKRADYISSKKQLIDLGNSIEKFGKYLYNKIGEYIFDPIISAYKAHPVLFTAGVLLALCYI